MDQNRKDAYRYLLYWSMLDIRQLQREKPSYSKEAMATLADWLHNLAYFSCIGFEGFNEEWFWSESNYMSTHYPQIHKRYKELFTARLNGVGWLGSDKV